LLLQNPHADPVQCTPHHYNLCFLHLTLSTYLHHGSSSKCSAVKILYGFHVFRHSKLSYSSLSLSLNLGYQIVIDSWG
jgi:hypothetical protein